ncbi:MAG: hypothetical protein U1D55_07315 [Phycisphaerae bacterium]
MTSARVVGWTTLAAIAVSALAILKVRSCQPVADARASAAGIETPVVEPATRTMHPAVNPVEQRAEASRADGDMTGRTSDANGKRANPADDRPFQTSRDLVRRVLDELFHDAQAWFAEHGPVAFWMGLLVGVPLGVIAGIVVSVAVFSMKWARWVMAIVAGIAVLVGTIGSLTGCNRAPDSAAGASATAQPATGELTDEAAGAVSVAMQLKAQSDQLAESNAHAVAVTQKLRAETDQKAKATLGLQTAKEIVQQELGSYVQEQGNAERVQKERLTTESVHAVVDDRFRHVRGEVVQLADVAKSVLMGEPLPSTAAGTTTATPSPQPPLDFTPTRRWNANLTVGVIIAVMLLAAVAVSLWCMLRQRDKQFDVKLAITTNGESSATSKTLRPGEGLTITPTGTTFWTGRSRPTGELTLRMAADGQHMSAVHTDGWTADTKPCVEGQRVVVGSPLRHRMGGTVVVESIVPHVPQTHRGAPAASIA